MLLVANPRAVNKQGVRNEIQIASDIARKIGDSTFAIPLRMQPFEAPFLIAPAQYIGCARGLAELLETLQDTYRVPRNAGQGETIWRVIQLIHAKTPVDTPERLISNWLPINRLPKKIRYYEFRGRIPVRQAQARINVAPWPLEGRLPWLSYLRSSPRSARSFRIATFDRAESRTARHRLSG